MKKITIVLLRVISFSFLLLILIWGCSRKHEDFRREDTLSVFPASATFHQLDVNLQKIVRAIQSRPNITSEFSSLIKDRDIVWGKSLISLRNNTLIALVPLKEARDKGFNSFVAVELDSILRFRTFDHKEFTAYAAKGNSEGPTLFEVNHALNALNHLGFGRTVYSTAGLPSMELKKLENYKRSSQQKRGKVMWAPVYTISNCYSWSACAGDGLGNCVGQIYYFTECINETMWFKSFDGGSYNMGGGGAGYPPGSGGGGGYDDPVIPSSAEDMKNVQILPPSIPIADANKYLACFNTSLPAKLTIYADQPVAGTTEPVSILGGIGHAYLTFEQNINGMMVRRTVGFYNQTTVDPFYNKSAPSTLGNDSTHEYNVKWETSLTSGQFNGMIQATINYAPVYNIENYNCANFVLDVAAAGGIDLPRSVGWWYTGSGLNPGALGEDLRKQPGAVSGKGHTEDNIGECR